MHTRSVNSWAIGFTTHCHSILASCFFSLWETVIIWIIHNGCMMVNAWLLFLNFFNGSHKMERMFNAIRIFVEKRTQSTMLYICVSQSTIFKIQSLPTLLTTLHNKCKSWHSSRSCYEIDILLCFLMDDIKDCGRNYHNFH